MFVNVDAAFVTVPEDQDQDFETLITEASEVLLPKEYMTSDWLY